MAEEKDSLEEQKNQDKIKDTKSKILDLIKQEKKLKDEIKKMSSKEKEDRDKSLKSEKEYKEILDDIVKNRKDLQKILKESQKDSEKEEGSVDSIDKSVSKTLSEKKKLNEASKKTNELASSLSSQLKTINSLILEADRIESNRNKKSEVTTKSKEKEIKATKEIIAESSKEQAVVQKDRPISELKPAPPKTEKPKTEIKPLSPISKPISELKPPVPKPKQELKPPPLSPPPKQKIEVKPIPPPKKPPLAPAIPPPPQKPPVQAEKELSILEKIGVRLSSILSSFNKKSEISKKTVNSINEQSNLTSQLLSSQKQVTSSKQSELNVSNKVNETINKSTENVKEKSKLVSDTVKDKNKELSVTKQIVIESGKIQIKPEKPKSIPLPPAPKPGMTTSMEGPLFKNRPPAKKPKKATPAVEKKETTVPTPKAPIKTKEESTTQKINVETKIDTAPLEEASSLVNKINNSNKAGIISIIESNKELNKKLKLLQIEQNYSASYKKQQKDKLTEQININNEKLIELGIDEKTQKSIIRNQKKESKKTPSPTKSPETVVEAAAPPKTPAPPKKQTVSAAAAPPPSPPSPEPVENINKSVEVSRDMLGITREISEAVKERAKIEGTTSDFQRQNIKLLDKVLSQRESIETAIETAREEGRDLEKIEGQISKNLETRVFLSKRISELQKTSNIDIAKTESKMVEIEQAIKEQMAAEEHVNKLRDHLLRSGKENRIQIEQSIKVEQELADKAAKRLEQLKSNLSVSEAEYVSLKKSLEENKKIEKSLKEQKEHQKEMTKKLGLFGFAVKNVGGILDHFGVGKVLKINEAYDEMRKKAENNGSKMQVMLTGLGTMAKSLSSSMFSFQGLAIGAIGLFTTLVKKAIEYQDKTFQAAAQLGVSVKQAKELKGEYSKIASANGQLALTTHDILETQVKMNEQLGFMAPHTNDMARDTTLIMRRFGASAESMAEMQVQAAKNGKTMMQTFSTVVGTGKAMAAKLKMHMTEKQILDGVAKVSDTVYMNFKGNIKALAEAVVQSKKLGLNLDQVNKIGDSLLNFEDSISKEMEAQLLTGKQIDMSKAREYALAGNTKKLMGEISRMTKDQGGYEKMNVIQKQAFAEAVGMSRDEMDKMYREQEKANKLGNLANASQSQQYNALLKRYKTHEKVAEVMGKEAADSANSASVQEKMSAAMERVNEAIGKAGQRLMPIIEKITNWLANTKDLEKTINSVVKGIISAGKFLSEWGGPLAKTLGALYVMKKLFDGYLYVTKLTAAMKAKNVVTTQTETAAEQMNNATKEQGQLIESKKLGTKQAKNALIKTEGISEAANNATQQQGEVIEQKRTYLRDAKGRFIKAETISEQANNAVQQQGEIIDQKRNISKQVKNTTTQAGNVSEQANNAIQQQGEIIEQKRAVTKKARNVQSKTELITETQNKTVQSVSEKTEKRRSITKKARAASSKAEMITEKTNLMTNQVGKNVDTVRLGMGRQQLTLSAAQGVKEKQAAGFSIANAIARVTGGSSFLGPGALAVAGIAATMLFGFLASVGGSAPGGQSAPTATLPEPGEAGGTGISPVNDAAENKKMINSALVGSRERGEAAKSNVNLTVVTNVDPVTGKSMKKVFNEDMSSRAVGDQSKMTVA